MIRKTTILVIIVVLLGKNFAVAQAPAKSVSIDTAEFKHLVTALGFGSPEKNCLLQFDKKCLFDYYDKALPGNPFKGDMQTDTLMWQHMGRRFRDGAFAHLETDVSLYLSLYRRAAIFYFLAGNAAQCNFAIQNLGFIYEERLHKYDSSLFFINLALNRWIQKGDTLSIANCSRNTSLTSFSTCLCSCNAANLLISAIVSATVFTGVNSTL